MNDFARTLRSSPTEAERVLWYRLRRRRVGGFRFRRQVPIGRYICDFVCPQARLVIELDGSQHFKRSDYDDRRTNFLRIGSRISCFPSFLERTLTGYSGRLS